MPYSKSATKARRAMRKEYGAKLGDRIFYALGNKRAGKGLKGKHRGHIAANAAYAKGKSWGKSGRRIINIRTSGKANLSHRNGHTHVRIKVG